MVISGNTQKLLRDYYYKRDNNTKEYPFDGNTETKLSGLPHLFYPLTDITNITKTAKLTLYLYYYQYLFVHIRKQSYLCKIIFLYFS